MEHQGKIDDLGFCPSFNCYSSDTVTSSAAAKVSCELQVSQFHDEFSDLDEEDFEFSLVLADNEISTADRQNVFPLFNRNLLINDEIDRETKGKNDDDDVDVDVDALSIPLRKLFIADREESSSSSSSEADELENVPSRKFCVSRTKADAESPPLTKCKKSSSTGSGSKRWRIRDFLRRSNSEGKEPMVLLTAKKSEVLKQKRIAGEASEVAGKPKSSPPSVHELFYVQRRAQRQDGKRKSYLPYRQGLVGFFMNVNGLGKKLPF